MALSFSNSAVNFQANHFRLPDFERHYTTRNRWITLVTGLNCFAAELMYFICSMMVVVNSRFFAFNRKSIRKLLPGLFKAAHVTTQRF